jgi:hypothetical protein
MHIFANYSGVALEMAYEVNIIGVEEAREKVDHKRAAALLSEGILKATIYTEGVIKKDTPVKTGRLKASWAHKTSATQGTVGTNVNYAQFVEYGTGIYIGRGRIHPRSARALAFNIGTTHLVRGSIKGQKGQFFVERAVESARPQIVSIIDGEMKKIEE